MEKLSEAQIETSSSKIKDELVSTTLDDDVLTSLDVKSLYSNIPVEESRSMAADLVYARDNTPDFSKKTFIELMSLAVGNVDIICGETWYRQVDGLAMGSNLAVHLANIWMIQFEKVIAGRGNFMRSDRPERTFPVVAYVSFPCGAKLHFRCLVSPPMHQPLDFAD